MPAADKPPTRTRRSRRAAGRGAALTRFDGAYYDRPGVALLCGVDEAGRGCLAGPVCVGAVILERDCGLPAVDDSKVLSRTRREELFDHVLRCATAAGVGWATAEEIDRINVLEATFLAARRAIRAMGMRPDYVLTDALKPAKLHPEEIGCEVEAIIDGDAKSRAIAAASILAKVSRDRLMARFDEEFPGYGLAGHKGYSAPVHIHALQTLGASTLHRHSFQGVDFFNREYVRSQRLEALLAELAQADIVATNPELEWCRRACRLPEAEWRIYRAAWEEKRHG